VSIKIYDALGRHVTTLAEGVKGAGVHSAEWNVRNSKGKPVTSGMYFYKMEAGDFTATRKMLVLR
jgi:flagellar hook assembly protein FlgD